MDHIAVVLIAFGTAALVTPIMSHYAMRWGVVDRPDGLRKVHSGPTPLLGGVALFFALVVTLTATIAFGWLPGDHIKEKYLVGILLASGLLAFGGALDDRFDLSPVKQIIWPLLAVVIVVASGIGIDFITSPFGGVIHLDKYVVTVLWWQGIPYKLTLLADIFTVVWLFGMTYTTKLLDGLDGLVSGTAAIGAIILAFVSVTREIAQPDTALLALAVAGIFLGFLIYNFPPASVFLGEGGSTLAGFLLGTLAIVSGGKVATALLVLGLPIFDAAFVILRRVFIERKSPTSADRSHLHLRLLDRGFSPRNILLYYWLVTTVFGISTFFLHGRQKLLALALLATGMGVSMVAAFSGRSDSFKLIRQKKKYE